MLSISSFTLALSNLLHLFSFSLLLFFLFYLFCSLCITSLLAAAVLSLLKQNTSPLPSIIFGGQVGQDGGLGLGTWRGRGKRTLGGAEAVGGRVGSFGGVGGG